MEWLHSSVVTLAIAGALGGCVRWRAVGDPWRKGVNNIFIGAVTSVYMWQIGTGILSVVFHPVLPSDAVITAEEGGFGIGLCGSMFVSFIMGIFSQWNSLARKG